MKHNIYIIGIAIAFILALHGCGQDAPDAGKRDNALEKDIREAEAAFDAEQDTVLQPLGNLADIRHPDMKIRVRKGNTLHLETDGFQLMAVDTAVMHTREYSVTSLLEEDLAPLPQGMKNMTAATAGYRLLPSGEHFSPYAELRVAYDPARLPLGYTPEDIYTSYYDTSTMAWVRLERLFIDTVNHEVVSATTHFTDFINELLKAPEMPETQAFVPTQMSDLEAVNPLDGIPLIQPPAANNDGTANLTYPLVIPAGRAGMQPNLSLTYNSSRGSGWLGVGWDIPIPAITLDTRWGVPRYDTTYETEIYLLNGEQLVTKDVLGNVRPMPHRTNQQTSRLPDGTQFFARTGDAHDSIIRYGDSPQKYWWKVIDRNGITHYYGHYHDASRNTPPLISSTIDTNTVISDSSSGNMHCYVTALGDANARQVDPFPTTLGDDQHNIARWMLTESRDLYGNTVRYYYDMATVRNRGAVGRQIYLDSISYTGHMDTDGYYTVVFCRTGNKTPDVPVSCNNGFKEITDQLLNNVYLKCGDKIQTIWHFETENGDSTNYKNRLTSVTKIDSMSDRSMRQFLNTVCHCLRQDEDEYGTAPYIYKSRYNNLNGRDSLILRNIYIPEFDGFVGNSDKDTVYRHVPYPLDSVWVTVLDTIHWNNMTLEEIQEMDYAGTTTSFSYYNAPGSNMMFDDPVTIPFNSVNLTNLHGSFLGNAQTNKPLLNTLSQATVLGLSTSSSRSVSGTAAVGLGSNVCLTNNSAGGNYTRTESSSESLMTLVDLDGDGLSDKVYVQNGTMYFCRMIWDNDNLFHFDNSEEVVGAYHFLEESSSGNTFGAQASLGVSASASWTNTKSTISTYFADVNGDGLVDLVNNGQVYFNRLRVEGNRRIPEFRRHSDIPIEPQDGEIVEYSPVTMSESSCQDIVFDGAADTGINCRRVWVLTDTSWAPLSDSGYYALQNCILTDTLYKTFKKKEHLFVETYHREWDCSYRDGMPNTDAVRVWIAPHTGTIAITSSIRLLENNSASRNAARHVDGVTLTIQRTSNIQHSDSCFNYGSTDTILLNEPLCATCYTPHVHNIPNISVTRGDMLFFRLRSNTDHNFDNIQDSFAIEYTGGATGHFDSREDFVLSNDLCFQAPVDGAYTIKGYLNSNNESVGVFVQENDSLYQADYSGTLYSGSLSKGDIVRVILHSDSYNVKWGNVVCKPRIVFEPTYGVHELYDTTNNGIDTIRFANNIEGWLTPQVETNDTCSLYDTPLYQCLFGPLHKGWGQFAYRSEGDSDTIVRIERLIPAMVPGINHTADSNHLAHGGGLDTAYFSQSETMEDFQDRTDLYNPYSSRSAWVEMTPDVQHWTWVSFGHQNAIGRDTMSNSWFSFSPREENLNDPDDHDFTIVNPMAATSYDDPVPSDYQGTPAKAVRKVNSTKSHSWSAGFAQWGASYSDGDNIIEMDYMDLNGDRYPDIIGTDKVQYSQQWGGIGPVTELPSNLSHGSASHTWSGGPSYSASEITHSRTICGTQQNAFFTMHSEGSKGVNLGGNIGYDKAGGSWVDMNGDGLPDFVYPDGSVRLNVGYDFRDDKQWGFENVRNGVSGSISFGADLQNVGDETNYLPDNVTNVYQGSIKAGFGINGSYNQTTHMLMDINGDGLPDKLWRELNHIDSILAGDDVIKTKVKYNLGNGKFSDAKRLDIGRFHSSASFNESLNLGLTCGFTFWGLKFTVGVSSCPYSGGVTQDYVQLADINGDGLPDWVYSTDEGSMEIRLNKNGKTNLLKSVNNFTGSSIRLDYTLSESSYEQPSRSWLMTRVTTDDPLNRNGERTTITEYAYANPYYDRYERMSYGYDSVVTKQIDPSTHDTLRYVEHGYSNRSLIRRGKLTRERIYDGGHNLYIEKLMHSTLVDYHNIDTVGDEQCPIIAYPLLEGIITHYYEGSDTIKLTTREVIRYDRYHNIRYDTLFGDVSDPNDDLMVELTYYDRQPNNLVGLRESYKITSVGTPSIMREAHFVHNGYGQLVEQTVGSGINPPAYNFIYDTTYGNLYKGIQPENNWGQRMEYTYTYDDTVHTYPVRIDNSYGEHSTTSYNYRFGRPLTVTDPSNNTMTYTYDFAGRLTSVRSPMCSGNDPSLKNQYYPINYYHNNFNPQGYVNTPSLSGHPYSVSMHYDDQGTLITQTAVITDGFGRVLQTKKGLTENGVEKIQVSGRAFVDAFGRVVKQGDPFTVSNTSIASWGRFDTLPVTTYVTCITYDVLDRKTMVTQPFGIATGFYYDIENDADSHRRFYTRVTDPEGNITHQYADYEGRQVQVTDALGDTTKMHFDNLGQLLWSEDPEGFRTLYGYDNLGRLTFREHPDAGITIYKYDPSGNLIKEINPLGEISYVYAYNRPLHKHYSFMDGNDVTYEYGTIGNERGRLWRITDGSGIYECLYDALGNVTDETRTIALPGNGNEVYRFQTKYNYDSWGRMLNMTYPDGEQVKYSYTWGGDLVSMDGDHTYIKNITYNGFGQRDSILYGNNTSAKYIYDSLHRLCLLKSYEQGGTVMQNVVYTFDRASNITSVFNNVSPLGSFDGHYENDYSYDALHRLVRSVGDNTLGNYNMEMRYSPSGRISYKYYDTPTGSLSPPKEMYYGYCDDFQPHAVRRIYDHEKRTLSDMRWDPSGNLGQVTIANDEGIAEQCRFLFWTEDNRLHTAVDDKHYSYYVYDHSGERRVKLTGENWSMDINAEEMSASSVLCDPTLYPSSYMVATNQGYTKHYYAGADRVAARLGRGGFSAIDYNDEMQINADILFEKCKDQVGDRSLEENDLDCITECDGDYEAELTERIEGIPRNVKTELKIDLGRFRLRMIEEKNIHDEEDTSVYYYHSDHLGSASWITNNYGSAVQHLQYLPYGEPFVNQRTSGYNERFTFTGKERDEETGYGYFGARYMDHELMTGWLSVDPMADKYPSVSPYNYCMWNPVKLVDPDGQEIWIGGLDEEIQQRLVKCLGQITGLQLAVKKGFLISTGINTKITEYSPSARKDLLEAIGNTDIRVYAEEYDNDFDLKGGDWGDIETNNIYISSSFHAGNEDYDAKTEGLGMSFLHELGHAYFGDNDPDPEPYSFIERTFDKRQPYPCYGTDLGEAVTRVNKYRAEMGMSTRASYESYNYRKGEPESWKKFEGQVAFREGKNIVYKTMK